MESPRGQPSLGQGHWEERAGSQTRAWDFSGGPERGLQQVAIPQPWGALRRHGTCGCLPVTLHLLPPHLKRFPGRQAPDPEPQNILLPAQRPHPRPHPRDLLLFPFWWVGFGGAGLVDPRSPPGVGGLEAEHGGCWTVVSLPSIL